jgi:hypothetical protein
MMFRSDLHYDQLKLLNTQCPRITEELHVPARGRYSDPGQACKSAKRRVVTLHIFGLQHSLLDWLS